jgi:hypothetical protein
MAKSPAWVDDKKSIKKCTKCEGAFPLSDFYTTGYKVSGERKYNSWCKPCVSKKQASYHKMTWSDEKMQFTAFKRTKSVRSFLQYLRSKAIQRKNNENFISLDELENLWFKQNGKCALTGWDLTMTLGKGVVNTNCSLDRIDSSIGYFKGNVQLVCRSANVAKNNLSMSEFLNLCKSISKKHNGCS